MLNRLILSAVLSLAFADLASSQEANRAAERIVVWENTDDDHRLTAITLADKKSQRLTARFGDNQLLADWPALLSPDGKWAAYPGTRFNDKADQEGIAQLRRLEKPDAKGQSLAAKGMPVCWSPDGQHLIVTDFDDDSFPQTLVYLKDGKCSPLTIPAIKDRESHIKFVADWSRDGKSWLVVCFDPKERDGRHESFLYLTKSDGTSPQILKHFENPTVARFSPDGKRILCMVGKDSDELVVAGIESSKPVRVSQATDGSINEFDFCWSPDGKRVAYIWRNDQSGADCETFLMVVDADGTNEQVLMSVKGEQNALRSPNWR